MHDVTNELERERYKMLQELERFRNIQTTLEEWQAEAAHDPVMRERLERMAALYGAEFVKELEVLTVQLEKVEADYRRFMQIAGEQGKCRLREKPQKIAVQGHHFSIAPQEKPHR